MYNNIYLLLLSYLFVLTIHSLPCSEEYISFLIPSQYKAFLGTTLTIGTNQGVSISIGFNFSYFGQVYENVTVSSNGYLTFDGVGSEKSFNGNFTTGESIWLWWMPFSGSSGTFKYITTGSMGNRSFIIDFLVQGVNIVLPPNGPDLCSDTLAGQVRLFEIDNSIELEIITAPLTLDGMPLAGIHSDVQNNTHFLINPHKFSFGESTWEGPFYGVSPHPAWSRALCPFPISGRFVCQQCPESGTCSFPPVRSGAKRCNYPHLDLTCSNNGICSQTQEYIPNIGSFATLAVLYPRNLNYLHTDICDLTSGCCINGPLTYLPPKNLTDISPLSDECYAAINDALCDYCNPLTAIVDEDKRQYVYTLSDTKDGIESLCNVTETGYDSIFSWPDFPLRANKLCSGSLTITERDGIITDGSYPGYYTTRMTCIWDFDIPFCSSLLLTFDRFATEESYDFLNISGINFDYGISGHYDKLLEVFPDGQVRLGCKFTVTFTTDIDILDTGFRFSYKADEIPTNYPILIYDKNNNVITTASKEIVIAPFGTTNYQYWNFTSSDNNQWTITNFFASDKIIGASDGRIKIFSVSDNFQWNVTTNNNISFISWSQYYLNNTNNGKLEPGLSLTKTPSTYWYFKDGISSTICQSTVINLPDQSDIGSFSDGSGLYLYPPGPYTCTIDIRILPGSNVYLEFLALDLGEGDTLSLELSETTKVYAGDLSLYTQKSITVDTDFSIVLNVLYGLRQGFEISYYVTCDSRCRAINLPTSISIYKPLFCRDAKYNNGPVCGNTYFTNETNIIDDGSGLGNYQSLVTCYWELNIPNAAAIAFYFCLFDTEAGFDYLYLIDLHEENWQGLRSYTGQLDTGKVPQAVFFPSNHIQLKFFTDLDISYNGFHIVYTALYNDTSCDCSQYCLHTNNGTLCTCKDGFTLDVDQKNCVDINECTFNFCENAHGCVNVPGSYKCSCDDGYRLSNFDNYCIEIDECSTYTHNCMDYCTNTLGNFTCSCKAPRILQSDGRSCIEGPIKFTPKEEFSLTFCNSPPINTTRHIITTGCDAISFTNENVTGQCIFPFVYENDTYTNCINIGFRKGERKANWCAIKVDDNLNVLEQGYCRCSSESKNIILNTASFDFLSGSPEKLNDGIKDDDIDTAYYMQQDEWYTTFSDWVQVKAIKIYGCPSCSKKREAFTFTIRLLTDVFNFDSPVWKIELGLVTNLDVYTLYLPPDVGYSRVVDISTSNNLYLAELELYADIYDTHNLIPKDCALIVSRSQNPFSNRLLLPEEISPNIVWYSSSVGIERSFVSSFSFYISSNASDTFSFIISNNVLLDRTIAISFDSFNRIIQLTKYIAGIYTFYPSNVQLNEAESPFTSNTDNYCSVIYDSGSTQLSLYINNAPSPLVFTIDIEGVLGGKELFLGFSASSNKTILLKRQLDAYPGYFQIKWWDFQTEEIQVIPIEEPPQDNLPIIVGAVVAIVVFLIIIIGVAYYCSRKTDIAVASLPSDVRRHYKQYSVRPHRWTLHGDPSQSHAFLKKIREGTRTHNRLETLWLEMGGSSIHWNEAFSVHNLLLLNGFATKYVSITSQVTNDPKNFMKDHWKNLDDPKGIRAWTRQQYDTWVARFPWNENLLVKIAPAIHGTSEDIAYNIIKTGFVALSKLDSGYYGKGIYFTTSVEYALPYFATKKSPTVIICLVISGNAYPVIEHPQLHGSFMGAALTPGYHSHYVLTRKDGYPCPVVSELERNEDFFDELVIEQEAAILPFYFLKISTDNLSSLALAFQKEQELLRKENAEMITKYKSNRNIEDDILVVREGNGEAELKTQSDSSSSSDE